MIGAKLGLHIRELAKKATEGASGPDSPGSSSQNFRGHTTRSDDFWLGLDEAIVHSGAAQDVIGRRHFEARTESLRAFGLRPIWLPEKSGPAGIGGSAKVLGCAVLPISMGAQLAGAVKVTVIDLLELLQAALDFGTNEFVSRSHDSIVPMRCSRPIGR